MQLTELAGLSPIDAWRFRTDIAEAMAAIEDPKLREKEQRRIGQRVDEGRKGYPRLVEKTPHGSRIRAKPPLIFPLSGPTDVDFGQAARAAIACYVTSLPEERRVLVERYTLADIAFKVVGVGSVGTFCAIALMTTPDHDRLLLQIKEAETSALAPFNRPSAYDNQGQRVVVGQRLMQAVSDIFLGWTDAPGDDRHCYVRQLKDGRLAAVAGDIEEEALPFYSTLCGRALARAHARTGDVARMVGYIGSGGALDSAISDFALAYADQTERDYRLFLDAIKSGWIEASSE
jgi:uncharacterized protein (DUF2252 family)